MQTSIKIIDKSSIISRSYMEVSDLKIKLVIIIFVLSFSSCSSIKGVFKRDTNGKNAIVKTVPKIQYDQLMEKYDKLLRDKRNENIVEGSEKQKSKERFNKVSVLKDVDGDKTILHSSVVGSSTVRATDDKSSKNLGETVDIFSKSQTSRAKVKNTVKMNFDSSKIKDSTIENEILTLRKARDLAQQKKYNKAFNYLKDLESSPLLQVQVRAKYLIGEMLYIQQEYDLSMQIFEEIINNYSFSGVVLKSLKKLIDCSSKLKLSKKNAHYSSILYDFFERK